MTLGNGHTDSILVEILREIHALRVDLKLTTQDHDRRLTDLEARNKSSPGRITMPSIPPQVLLLGAKMLVILILLRFWPDSDLIPLIGF